MFLNDLAATLGRIPIPFRTPRAFLAGAILLIAAAGCSSDKVAGPGVKPVPMTLKTISARAAQAGSPAAALASGGSFSAAASQDTIPVTFTKALLVIRDVRFKLSEGAEADSIGDDDDEMGENDSTGVHEDDDDEGEGMVIFRGPFVLDLLAQTAESLDTQMVLPGDYRRVQGHIRELRSGDWNASNFDFLIGSTVFLEGTVDGDGGGPFTYKARINDEFQIRGKFTVDAETPATAFIVFDISKWLRTRTGTFLDPRDADNDRAIRSAIRHAIKVGMDDNHDGHCDDDMHADGE
jgi:hypothetical protein